MKLVEQQAKAIGDQLEISWEEIDLAEFTIGLNVELEHGKRYPETNLTDDDPKLTGKIAWAHLKEFPDYYTRLEKMEKDAKTLWQEKQK